MTGVQAIPEIFASFQCARCGAQNPNWVSSNHSDHLFASSGALTCRGCSSRFPVENGYLDLCPGPDEEVVPIQKLMQLRPVVAVYEGVWRPLGYFIASKHSFIRDVERIATLIRAPRGMFLDLACGPGNVTRQIARRNPDSIVVGFDLSREMLDRAVRLTRKEGLRNVYYMRGSALSLPFKDASFDAVSCCGALQLFQDQDQAWRQIHRVLKVGGEFVCQTTLGPRRPPLYVRAADRLLKFGYFYLDDLKEMLFRFNFDLVSEERSNINYIFLAAKTGE
ncbi:MAG TPA: methyltransferase domain-containing protein [Terriglobia bacterium]|nr:methyltransferase domain-containing protein [Terriglobia bacterium]